MARSTRTSRSWRCLVAVGFCAGIAALAQGTADAAATSSATASVSPAAVALGESGTAYTFTVTNTGTATVRTVQVVQPSTGWTISSCSGPVGWAASKSSSACKYTTPQDGPNPIAPAQTAAFKLNATSLAGTADRTGTWGVSIVPNKVIAASPASAGALTTTAHSFRVLDAVVANAAATPGAACPAPNKSAPSASTKVIVVCGRNATTTTLTPVAARSSVGGTFLQSPGTFASGPVAPTATSVVLGSWSGATVTNSVGSAKTIVARIGSAANRTSALTTLTGYATSNSGPAVGAASFSVPENSANGTPVGTASFTDPDSGQTGTFAITAGNAGGAFAIHAGTGAITVADGSQLDHETTSSYALTVRVTDNGTPALSGSNTVTVNVTNVNEAPVVGAAIFSVPENSANATPVGSASFTDPDTGQTAAFAITAGNPDGAFAIDAGTGAIRVADGSQLDFETTPSYALTVQVTDNGTPALSGSNTVTVNVTNVNEAPVVGAATFSVPENSAENTPVGTASFTDPDAGQTAAFAITAGNTDGAFAIDAGTGAITVADGSLLNFEATPSYALTVQVTDNGTPALSGSNTVFVNVTDVDETPVAAPVAVDDETTVVENAAATVVDVLVNDSGAGLSVTGVDTTGTLGQAAVANGGANVTYNPNGAFDSLGQGETATDTFDYSVTGDGGTDTGSVTVTVTGGQLTLVIRVDEERTVSEATPIGVEGSADHVFDAVIDNAPASGVSYLWWVDTTAEPDFRVNPVHTDPTLFVPHDVIPLFSQPCRIFLSVTPNNGTPAAEVHGRFLYQNSALLNSDVTRILGDPGVVPQATPSTISVGDSLDVTNVSVSTVPRINGLIGNVTYSVGTTVLGTSHVGSPFPISGATLGVGTHTITVYYEIWHGIAYPPFTRTVTVTVTA